MTKILLVAAALGLVYLVIFDPLWLTIPAIFGWRWLTCPDWNPMSTTCGSYTADFVVTRLIVIIPAGAALFFAGRGAYRNLTKE